MAGIWTGTVLNNNAAANLMNIVYKREAIDIVSTKNGLLYLVQKRQKGKINPGAFDFAKDSVTRMDGDHLRVKWFGELETVPTVADGGGELAHVTPSWNDNEEGGGLFDITHYFDVKAVPESEYKRFEGAEAATVNWLGSKIMRYSASLDKTMAVALNAAAVGGTRTVFSTWQHAVSNGTTNVAGFNETLLASYGTVDRSDAGNAGLRSYVRDVNGAWGLTDLKYCKIKANKTNPGAQGVDLALCGEAQFVRAQGLLEALNIVQVNGVQDWADYGSEYFRYAKMTFCYEPELPDDRMGILDSSTWVEWDDNPGKIVTGGAMYDDPFAAAKLTKVNKWCSIICVSPGNNAKMIRLT